VEPPNRCSAWPPRHVRDWKPLRPQPCGPTCVRGNVTYWLSH